MRTQIRSTRSDNWMPLQRLGARRLTRAHLELAKRPQLAASAAKVVSRCAAALSAQLGMPLTVEAKRVEHLAQPARELAALAAFGIFEIASGARAILELGVPDAVALVERLCGARASKGPVLELTRLEEGAVGFLLLVALAELRVEPALEQTWAPRLIAVQSDRAAVVQDLGTVPHVAFDLTLRLGERTGKARLYVPSEAACLALQQVPEASVCAPAEAVGRAEVRIACRAGRCDLGPGELSALTPGDVVLFGGARFDQRQVLGPARLLSRTFELEGSFEPDGFHPTRGTRRVHPLEASMSADEASTLPVELEVELTRVSLAISELSALGPGSVLPLHMNVSKPVLLRVGDRVVAKAELVEVEGEIGARIVSLTP